MASSVASADLAGRSAGPGRQGDSPDAPVLARIEEKRSAVMTAIHNRGGEIVAHQYRCEKCGHVSDRPGSCCGQPLKAVS
jgi:hypothetical protein